MKKMKKTINFILEYLHLFIFGFVAILCVLFLIFGHTSKNGKYITLDGSDAQITNTTKQWIDDANAALDRIMNQDKPTDEETIKANDGEEVGLGFTTSIDDILGRRLPDGDTDGGRGWQCSKYTAYLATGKREYSTAHPDYGPVNGKDVAAYLVKNYGFKYIDQPVAGAIGSGGFNTLYGHTVMYLYSTGNNTAMVNDANYSPLAVATHNMNISGWKWVVPENYEPKPEPTPTPTPTPTPKPNPNPTPTPKPNPTPSSTPVSTCDKWTLVWGDTLGKIMKACEGKIVWGETMNSYAKSWYDTTTGKSVWEGWTSGVGIGLYAGHTIERKK